MADLLFRRGKLANLPAQKVDGSIYITTDEPGLYIDVTLDNEVVRQRIGDFITFDSLTDLQNAAIAANGKFSTKALYYVTDGNYLLKYNGTGSSFTHVNSTKDLEDKVFGDGDTTIVSRLSTAESDIDALQLALGLGGSGSNSVEDKLKSITGNGTSTATTGQSLQDIVGSSGTVSATGSAKDLTTLTSELATVKTTADAAATKTDLQTLDSTVTSIGNRVGTAETNINKLKTDVEAVPGQITSAVDGAKTELNAEIVKNTKAISTNTTNITTLDSTLSAVQTQSNQNKTNIETNKTNIEKNTDAIAKLNDDASVVGSVDYKVATAKSELAISIKTAQDTANDASSAASGAQNTADKNTAAIAKLNGSDEGSVAKAVADSATTLRGEIATVDTIADEAKAQAEANAKKITELDTALDATNTAASDLAERVTANENAIITITGDGVGSITKAVSDAKTDLNESITTNTTNIAGLVTRIDGVDAEIESVKTDASKLAGRVTTAEKDIDTLEGKMTTAEGKITTIEGQITTISGTGDGSFKKAISDAVTALETADEGLQNNINALSGNVYTKAQIGDWTNDENAAAGSLVAWAKSEIDEKIAAADAMQYIGTINAYSDLPASAEDGHTYVVGTTFDVSGTTYNVGDLVIRAGNDTKWDLVRTGYEASLNPKLTAVSTTADEVAEIRLSAYTDANGSGGLGKVGINTSAAPNLTVTTANNVMSFKMVWDEF